jgi:membrane protease YdiL (CAAX protease family)
MRLRLILLLLFTEVCLLHCQSSDTLKQNPPNSFPGWTLLVPGATYYYDGRVVEGLTFSTLEIGGIIMGIQYDNTLKSGSNSPYYNYPLLLGMQAYNIDKCDWVRNKLELVKYKHPDFQYDPISEKDLFLAPFKIENIFTPVTLGMAGIACLELWFQGRGVDKHINQVQQMYFLDHYIDRNSGLAIFGTTSLAVSWGAGVSEEYWMRNGVMPLLDYKYGQTKGLYYSSFAFGLLHIPNLLFADKPDYGQALAQFIETTLAGLILGTDVQNRGYQIGPAVAAHAWYDFILMFGSFLVDPTNNGFAVQVKFNVQ